MELEAYERDYRAALSRLAVLSEDTPVRAALNDLWEGDLYRLVNRPEQARASYEAARLTLEKTLRDDPDAPLARGLLGWAHAGLGRKAEAIREARRGVELLPVSKDAYAGVWEVWSLAVVYAMVGDHDAAIDQLEYLLSIPSWWSAWDLRLDPRWDPLRDHPRFKKLVGEDWQAEASTR